MKLKVRVRTDGGPHAWLTFWQDGANTGVLAMMPHDAAIFLRHLKAARTEEFEVEIEYSDERPPKPGEE